MVTILNNDALSALHIIADGSVDCCVCSPPYYNLRVYQCPMVWGGDKNCEHVFDVLLICLPLNVPVFLPNNCEYKHNHHEAAYILHNSNNFEYLLFLILFRRFDGF